LQLSVQKHGMGSSERVIPAKACPELGLGLLQRCLRASAAGQNEACCGLAARHTTVVGDSFGQLRHNMERNEAHHIRITSSADRLNR